MKHDDDEGVFLHGTENAARGMVNGCLFGALLWAIIFSLFWAVTAEASPPHNRPPDNRPPNGTQASQTTTIETGAEASSRSNSSAESLSTSTSSATGGTAHAEGGQGGHGGQGGTGGDAQSSATATNSGVNLSGGDTSFHSESNNTNVVLVPNNNTENCLRVWGLSWGNSSGAGGIGVPQRSAACDYEQAADDAAALGNHKMAWYWRCHKKNIYKPFRKGNRTAPEAIRACFDEMSTLLDMQDPEPVPTGSVIITEDEYDSLLMAQVQQEELEQLEDRYAQQQSLIEELQDEIEDHDLEQAEIERLKREAAELRRAQEARKAAELQQQQKFKERLRAKEDE